MAAETTAKKDITDKLTKEEAAEKIRDLIYYCGGQTAMSKEFGIPLRTVQNWAAGDRLPPDYVIAMIEKILSMK